MAVKYARLLSTPIMMVPGRARVAVPARYVQTVVNHTAATLGTQAGVSKGAFLIRGLQPPG